MGPHWLESSLTKGLRHLGLEGWSKARPGIFHPLWFSSYKLRLEAQTPSCRGWQTAGEKPREEGRLHPDAASMPCFLLKPWGPDEEALVGTLGSHNAHVLSHTSRVMVTRYCWAGLGLTSPQMPLPLPSPRLPGWAVLGPGWAVPGSLHRGSLSLSDLTISSPWPVLLPPPAHCLCLSLKEKPLHRIHSQKWFWVQHPQCMFFPLGQSKGPTWGHHEDRKSTLQPALGLLHLPVPRAVHQPAQACLGIHLGACPRSLDQHQAQKAAPRPGRAAPLGPWHGLPGWFLHITAAGADVSSCEPHVEVRCWAGARHSL